MNKKVLCILMLVIAIAVTAVAYFLLPDIIVTKYDFSGNPTQSMSKLAGLGIPLIFCIVGSLMYAFTSADNSRKSITLYVIGMILVVMLTIFNMAKK